MEGGLLDSYHPSAPSTPKKPLGALPGATTLFPRQLANERHAACARRQNVPLPLQGQPSRVGFARATRVGGVEGQSGTGPMGGAPPIARRAEGWCRLAERDEVRGQSCTVLLLEE